MRILAIDPGPDTSGWALYDKGEHAVVASKSEEPNENLDTWIIAVRCGNRGDFHDFDELAIEDVVNYGKIVGADVFTTCKRIGWFARAWKGDDPYGKETRLITRPTVKLNLCGGNTYTDPMRGTPRKVGPAEIRAAIMERFPATGGGKRPVIGIKKQKGPLFGMTGEHAWSALAVAICWADLQSRKAHEANR